MSDDRRTSDPAGKASLRGTGRAVKAVALTLALTVPGAHAQNSADLPTFDRPSLTPGVTQDGQLIRQLNDLFMVANGLCEQGDMSQCSTLKGLIQGGFRVFSDSRDCIEGIRSGCESYAMFRAQLNVFYTDYTAVHGTPDHDALMLDMPLAEREAEWAEKLEAIFAPGPRLIEPCAAITPQCGQFDPAAMRQNQLYFLDLIGVATPEK